MKAIEAIMTVVWVITDFPLSSLAINEPEVEEIEVEVGSNATLKWEGDVEEGCRFNTVSCCYSAKRRGDTMCNPENQGKICKKENSFMVEELVTKKIFPNSEMFIGHCVLHLYNVTNNDEGNYIVVFPGKVADNGEIILKVNEMKTDNEDGNFTEVFPGKVKDNGEIIHEVEEMKRRESKEMTSDSWLWLLIIVCLLLVIVIFICSLTIWKVKKRLLHNERLHDNVEESEDKCSSSVLPWNWKCFDRLVDVVIEKILPRTNTEEKDPEEGNKLIIDMVPVADIGDTKRDVTCETIVEMGGMEGELSHGNIEVLLERKMEKLNLLEEITQKKNETKTNMEEEKERNETERIKKLEDDMERLKKKDEETERIKKLKGAADKKYLAEKKRANELKKKQKERDKEKISEQLIEETTEANKQNPIISASPVNSFNSVVNYSNPVNQTTSVNPVTTVDLIVSTNQVNSGNPVLAVDTVSSVDMVSSEDRVPLLDIVSSKDTNPSVDMVHPVDTVPSLDLVSSEDTVLSLDTVPSEETVPSKDSKSSVDTVPSVDIVPSVDTVPSVAIVSSEDTVSSVDTVPPLDTVPSTESTVSSQSPHLSSPFSLSQPHDLLPVQTNKDAEKSRQKRKENILNHKRGISVNQGEEMGEEKENPVFVGPIFEQKPEEEEIKYDDDDEDL